MKYQIIAPITTNVEFIIEAPEGLSKKALMEIIENTNLRLDHEGFMRDEVEGMVYDLKRGNGYIYDEEMNDLFE